MRACMFTAGTTGSCHCTTIFCRGAVRPRTQNPLRQLGTGIRFVVERCIQFFADCHIVTYSCFCRDQLAERPQVRLQCFALHTGGHHETSHQVAAKPQQEVRCHWLNNNSTAAPVLLQKIWLLFHYLVFLQVGSWHKVVNAVVGGAAVLSVMLSVAAPAQAEPFFQQKSKPALQEMKVSCQNPLTHVECKLAITHPCVVHCGSAQFAEANVAMLSLPVTHV